MSQTMDSIQREGEQCARADVAVVALRASVMFSAELVGIVDMLSGRGPFRLSLSNLNRTATIKNMRKHLAAMTAFIDEIDQKG